MVSYLVRIMTTTELMGFKQVAPLVGESSELVAILATIVRRTYERGQVRKPNDK